MTKLDQGRPIVFAVAAGLLILGFLGGYLFGHRREPPKMPEAPPIVQPAVPVTLSAPVQPPQPIPQTTPEKKAVPIARSYF